MENQIGEDRKINETKLKKASLVFVYRQSYNAITTIKYFILFCLFEPDKVQTKIDYTAVHCLCQLVTGDHV